MKKSVNTLLLIIVSFISCKKEEANYPINCNKPTNDIAISKSLFQGKWVWVSEYYVQPFTGNIFFKTPTTEGYTMQLVVANNTVLQFYKNDSLNQLYQYEFVQEKTITNYFSDTTIVLVFKDYSTGVRNNFVHYKICNDTLTLNYQITTDHAGQQKWFKLK